MKWLPCFYVDVLTDPRKQWRAVTEITGEERLLAGPKTGFQHAYEPEEAALVKFNRLRGPTSVREIKREYFKILLRPRKPLPSTDRSASQGEKKARIQGTPSSSEDKRGGSLPSPRHARGNRCPGF